MLIRYPKTFEKSFASHEKATFWAYDLNNGLTPRDVSRSNGNKYWVRCADGNHPFDIALNAVVGGKWCRFPCCAGNGKLCENLTCEVCFNASFSVHFKSSLWSYELNNGLTPRDFYMVSGLKCWFRYSDIDGHIFDVTLANVTNGYWCPYPCCDSSPKLCKDSGCATCYFGSFASNTDSDFWELWIK